MPICPSASAAGILLCRCGDRDRTRHRGGGQEDGTRRVGLLVDDLLGQQQAVIKSLEAHYRRVHGISGATILSDGSVALIVDVGGIVQLGLGCKQAA